MKRLSRYLALCTSIMGVAVAISYFLKTDRIYTHFFYIPIAIAASQYPRYTGLIGIFFALIHLMVEFLLRGNIDTIVLFRATIMVTVAFSLVGIWGREQRYQQTIKDLDYQRYHDGLTGVFNRTYFENLDRDALIYPVALFSVDVDGLKKVNDKYGHLAGDQYIMATTQVLKSCLRERDGLIRMGGDEFLVLVESCETTRAAAIVDRIEDALVYYNVSRNPAIMPLDLSVSSAYVICHGSHAFEVDLEKADHMMYAHKERKRKAASG